MVFTRAFLECPGWLSRHCCVVATVSLVVDRASRVMVKVLLCSC